MLMVLWSCKRNFLTLRSFKGVISFCLEFRGFCIFGLPKEWQGVKIFLTAMNANVAANPLQ
jgi:hypothetical protein